MSDIAIPLVQITGTALVLALLFALSGHWLYRRGFPDDAGVHPAFAWPASFFIGLYLFVFLFRVGAFALADARLACYLAVIAVGLLAYRSWRERRPDVAALTQVGWMAVLVLGFAALNVIRFQPVFESINAFTDLGGVGGSPIPLYVAEENQAPRLTQNDGQSLLTAAQLFLGCSGPLAILLVWLVLTQAAFTLLVYGALRRLGLATRIAIAGSVLVALGNVGLSHLHDTSSPSIYTGYPNTMCALATYLIFVIWLRDWLVEPRYISALLLPALFASSWAVSGPQNAVVGLGLVGVLALIRPADRRRLIILGLLLVAATAGGAIFMSDSTAASRAPTGQSTP
jgi:hypothetical protein